MLELTEGILERDSSKIHYWAGGKQDAPWVVFTHGATVDHHEWEATLPLVGERFRILTWDVGGHGVSRPSKFNLPQAEADLLAIMDRLQMQQAIFVGHSMGGNLHQELVFHHPERVRAMAFLDCTWNFQKLSGMEKLLLASAGPLFKLYPYQLLVDQSLQMTTISKASQDLLRPAMQTLSKDEFAEIMIATSACLHYEPGYQINKPLLLMVGEQDATGNIRKVMPVWAQHEPQCRFEIIPNARHAPNLDNPAYFHRLLLEFLNPFTT
jgi:3-oxoadipate enol-lactonase